MYNDIALNKWRQLDHLHIHILSYILPFKSWWCWNKSITGIAICCSVPWLDPPPPQCYNMGHSGLGINLYGVLMILTYTYMHGDILIGGLSVLVHRYMSYVSASMYQRLCICVCVCDCMGLLQYVAIDCMVINGWYQAQNNCNSRTEWSINIVLSIYEVPYCIISLSTPLL